MSDLIWIGNTLYPRWVVFAMLAMTVLAMIGFCYALKMSIRNLLQCFRKIL